MQALTSMNPVTPRTEVVSDTGDITVRDKRSSGSRRDPRHTKLLLPSGHDSFPFCLASPHPQEGARGYSVHQADRRGWGISCLPLLLRLEGRRT